MSKELPFFKFTANEWLTGDINFEPYEIQGLFISVCSTYWSKDCSISLARLKQRFSNATPEQWQHLIDADYIKVVEDQIHIDFLDEQIDELKAQHQKKVAAGRKGGLARSKQRLSNAKAELKHKDIDIDIDIDIDKEKDRESNSAPTKIDILNFTKSALASIATSLPESECKKIAKSFYDYYGSQGWRKANGMPITDYKLAVSQWVTKEMNSKRKEWKAPEKVNYDPPREIKSAMSDLAKKMKG